MFCYYTNVYATILISLSMTNHNELTIYFLTVLFQPFIVYFMMTQGPN